MGGAGQSGTSDVLTLKERKGMSGVMVRRIGGVNGAPGLLTVAPAGNRKGPRQTWASAGWKMNRTARHSSIALRPSSVMQ